VYTLQIANQLESILRAASPARAWPHLLRIAVPLLQKPPDSSTTTSSSSSSISSRSSAAPYFALDQTRTLLSRLQLLTGSLRSADLTATASTTGVNSVSGPALPVLSSDKQQQLRAALEAALHYGTVAAAAAAAAPAAAASSLKGRSVALLCAHELLGQCVVTCGAPPAWI
jgi:hypothetical protein